MTANAENWPKTAAFLIAKGRKGSFRIGLLTLALEPCGTCH
jgi:hypothetical protein